MFNEHKHSEKKESISDDPNVTTAAWDDKVNGRSSAAYKHENGLNQIEDAETAIVDHENDPYADY